MAELLDNVAHAQMRVHIGRGSEFGDAVNQAAVFPAELGRMAQDYPILFRRNPDSDLLQPLAILGLDRDENLFLDNAAWTGRAVPAILRHGPFSLGPSASGEPVVLVDTTHPRIAQGGEGEPIFLRHGGHAPALEDAMDALQILRAGLADLRAMTETFDALHLVDSVDLQVEVDDSRRYNFEGYGAITPASLAALSPDQLGRLNETGFLFTAVLAAQSLDNMNYLVRRKRLRLRTH